MLFVIIIFFYFILLYNTVLVLPYIDLNPPRVYMRSQTWTPLPPPSPLAVAMGLQLEHRLESSERFMFPIARPLPLCSWFSRFLLGSGTLQFKTHKWCCDWSREITAEMEAAAVPHRSPLPGVLSGDWEQLSAAVCSVFVCLLSERISQPKEITFLGASGISPVLLYPISLSLSHTHTHPMAMTGWYGYKSPTPLLSVVFLVPQFKHTGQTKATLWLSSLHCLAHFPFPHSSSLTLLPLRACPQ